MSIIIGNAWSDERGKSSGGKAGDQTGREVKTQPFYLSSKGWTVLRAKSAKVRNKIAQNMLWACESPNIGYDQSQRDTLYNLVKSSGFSCEHVRKAVECDCSSLVRVCVNYAGITVGDFYTGNEVSILMATGQFKRMDYTADTKLIVGDIIVTKTKGHTAVVVSVTEDLPTLRVGSSGEYVVKLQQALLDKKFKTCVIDGKRKTLVPDGAFGVITETILKRYQAYEGLEADGICGRLTWAKLC